MGFISQAARGLAGATGPRVTVLLVSEGVTYDTDKMTDPKSSDTIRAVKQAVESLKRGNVILYAIDPRGLATRDADDTLASQIQNEVADHDALTKYRLDDPLRISVQSLVHLSEATGGFALVNANDYRAGLDRVVREAGIYYLLGYAPTTPAREGEFQRSRSRCGVRVCGFRLDRGTCANLPDLSCRANPRCALGHRQLTRYIGRCPPPVFDCASSRFCCPTPLGVGG